MKGKFKAKKAITNPETGGYYFLIKNSWWIVDENDSPVYYDGQAPQCNTDKKTTENIMTGYMAKDYIPRSFKIKFYENIFEFVPQSKIKGF